MLALFVFGSFWFWGLLAVTSLLLIYALECESGAGATSIVVGTLIALLVLGNAGWLGWIVANPLTLLLWVAGYLSVGVGYGVVKWWLYVLGAADKYRDVRYAWLKRNALDESSPNLPAYKDALKTGVLGAIVMDSWKEYTKNRGLKLPTVHGSKGRIVTWMAYWPWSAIWTFVNDPVRRFFNWAYGRVSGILQRISDRVFKDIDTRL
jgi:hypothetical protein